MRMIACVVGLAVTSRGNPANMMPVECVVCCDVFAVENNYICRLCGQRAGSSFFLSFFLSAFLHMRGSVCDRF